MSSIILWFVYAGMLWLNVWGVFMQKYHRLAPIVLAFGDWADETDVPLISHKLREYYLSDGEINTKKIVEVGVTPTAHLFY